jgi:hypothetical protein
MSCGDSLPAQGILGVLLRRLAVRTSGSALWESVLSPVFDQILEGDLAVDQRPSRVI